ncbi:MAG: glycoside hydrolase family 127 protein [Bacillota bacterium]|nr:glycoside hydrolase family 127 protein [Bacillota bacterium]
MNKNRSKPCTNTMLKTGFLAERAQLIRDKVIPYQWDALNDKIAGAEPSHAIENYRIAAGESTGDFKGMVFQDSDLAKWLETVAFSLMVYPDEELEATADEAIALVARAQQPDGYLNTYYTIKEPDKRWTNLRENHELYCAGHFIEAAVAYYEATGKDELLKVVCKFADHIDSIFGPEENKKKGYPGHEEIELALIKLYKVTSEKRYLDLAKYFIEERGKEPHYFTQEATERGDDPLLHWGMWDHTYSQCHKPVREQTTAIGHSVRAVYLYTALADLVLETDDKKLLDVCEKLWDSAVNRQMYITGAIGSQEYGERFTIDYDLPNDRAYAETCASIALIFWAHRMLQIDPKGQYGDVLERALYNGVLSGMSLSGDKFFYVNPLEVWPEAAEVRYDHRHVEVNRQEWFGCACCPPNLGRLLASIHRYIYTQNDNNLYVHLFAHSELDTEIRGEAVKIHQVTAYPREEEVKIQLESETDLQFSLNIRIPQWCTDPLIEINGETVQDPTIEKGYLALNRSWSNGDEVIITLHMEVQTIWANPNVRVNIGKVALQRGPIVYCLEEVDNGSNLPAIYLPEDTTFSVEYDEQIQMPVLLTNALRLDDSKEELYATQKFSAKSVPLKAIPYFAWNNRGEGEMLVWINSGGIN